MIQKFHTSVIASLWLSSMLGCSQTTPSAADVTYLSGAPVAPWTDQQSSANGQPNPGNVNVAGTGTAGTGSGGGGASGSGGTSVVGMTGGRGSSSTGGVGGINAGGTGGMAAGGTGGAMTTPDPTMKATLDFSTLNQGGRYAPRNIGAVWVANSAGGYVKTMEVWARTRARYLSKWLTANPASDRVDAVSQATLPAPTSHHSTWSMKDSTGAVAPDGEYTIYIESTDHDGAGPWTSFKFTKGPKPQTVMPPDTSAFVGIKLVYQ